MKIQMVDLKGQYEKIKGDINSAIQNVIENAAFINGPQVKVFEEQLASYLSAENVIGCANGTDALQIALMALNLKPGDEVIVPCFTYVATAEVIGLLGLTPVIVDVDAYTFNCKEEDIKKAITNKTKAIVPVHLFGQCADMESILEVAKSYKLAVIEDTAQALGAEYTFSDGTIKKAGTMGNIGCTSFFPSKNLGCYGDGGALITNDSDLADRIRMIANHGQRSKYFHEFIGVNSRLDTLQAAILSVKLPYLDKYAKARNLVAEYYDESFFPLEWMEAPYRASYSTHVFHQYTVTLSPSIDRESLKGHLQLKGIPCMIYYPLPLHKQVAYQSDRFLVGQFPVSEDLSGRVLSFPIHTEMTVEELRYITESIKSYKYV